MARVIKKPGDIFKIPLSKGNHAYVQWLSDGTVRVFKAAYDSDVIIDEIIELPVAFRVVVYRDTPGRYGWIKIGKASIPEEFAEPQHYAKKISLQGSSVFGIKIRDYLQLSMMCGDWKPLRYGRIHILLSVLRLS